MVKANTETMPGRTMGTMARSSREPTPDTITAPEQAPAVGQWPSIVPMEDR
jgi:hypothetical protein